jgi:hypothetical protein
MEVVFDGFCRNVVITGVRISQKEHLVCLAKAVMTCRSSASLVLVNIDSTLVLVYVAHSWEVNNIRTSIVIIK